MANTIGFFRNIYDYLWTEIIGNIILMLFAFFLLAIVVQISSYEIITNISKEVMSPLRNSDTLQSRTVNILFQSSNSKRVQVLKGQYNIAEQLKRCYRDTAIEYYNNFYAFTICLTVFTTLLSLSVFLLAHNGWQNSQPKFKAFFILCAFFASFYYFIPNVLDNQSNVKGNLSQMKTFKSIQLDILSFTTSNSPYEDSLKYNKMICNVDSLIKSNYDFITNIDPSKIGTNPTSALNNISSGK